MTTDSQMDECLTDKPEGGDTNFQRTQDESPSPDRASSPISRRLPIFAAYVPNSPKRHIFTELKELRTFLNSPECKKLNTSARFKRCDNVNEVDSFYIEAEESEANLTTDSVASTSSTQSTGEFKSPFSEPPPPMLNQFRRSIEDKKNERFDELLADNPRFILNTSADVPTILQGSQRHNALHVACSYGNFHVVKKIFQLLQDSVFIERAYGLNKYNIMEDIEVQLLNCFLNIPDKIANNTPLHFAARGGHVEIVEFLLKFPECLRERKNHFGKTPFDLICQNYKGPAENASDVKKQLSKLLRKTTVEVPPCPSPPLADFSRLQLSSHSLENEQTEDKDVAGDVENKMELNEDTEEIKVDPQSSWLRCSII
ncbi:hypothetical protein M3Y96_01180000 [Aphelenchoides besseyi]|nr:hypothetical protein M3Y96_01180000 [Aphelenchoides besseyi]